MYIGFKFNSACIVFLVAMGKKQNNKLKMKKKIHNKNRLRNCKVSLFIHFKEVRLHVSCRVALETGGALWLFKQEMKLEFLVRSGEAIHLEGKCHSVTVLQNCRNCIACWSVWAVLVSVDVTFVLPGCFLSLSNSRVHYVLNQPSFSLHNECLYWTFYGFYKKVSLTFVP